MKWFIKKIENPTPYEELFPNERGGNNIIYRYAVFCVLADGRRIGYTIAPEYKQAKMTLINLRTYPPSLATLHKKETDRSSEEPIYFRFLNKCIDA